MYLQRKKKRDAPLKSTCRIRMVKGKRIKFEHSTTNALLRKKYQGFEHEKENIN